MPVNTGALAELELDDLLLEVELEVLLEDVELDVLLDEVEVATELEVLLEDVEVATELEVVTVPQTALVSVAAFLPTPAYWASLSFTQAAATGE